MIYCVWYPSGGFGHFVNAILTLHGENFVRPHNNLNFSPDGNSHNLDVVVPKYFHNHWPHEFEFDKNKNYSVLIDNGIDDENNTFETEFSNATVIKICYTDHSWPVVARTMIYKAMKSSIESALPIDEWDVDEPWARREKYFLFLRDHQLKNAWRPANENFINVEHLFDYNNFYNRLNKFVELESFEDIWQQWRAANSRYIDPVETANLAMQHIKNKQTLDLRQVTDVWDQAVIYYYFWIWFGIEVPHYDFANWIDSTDQLTALL
jgi:hypothetical protein